MQCDGEQEPKERTREQANFQQALRNNTIYKRV